MPTKDISNPQGLYGQAADFGGQLVIHVNNGAAAARKVGDLVILAAPASAFWTPSVATTTTAAVMNVLGVVGEPNEGFIDQGYIGTAPTYATTTGSSGTSYAVGAEMPVIIFGPARINIGSNTVASLDHLFSFTTAGQAQSETTATLAHTGSYIGIALEAQTAIDANNTIRCLIKPH